MVPKVDIFRLAKIFSLHYSNFFQFCAKSHEKCHFRRNSMIALKEQRNCIFVLHNDCLYSRYHVFFISVFLFSLISKKRHSVINIWAQLIIKKHGPRKTIKSCIKNYCNQNIEETHSNHLTFLMVEISKSLTYVNHNFMREFLWVSHKAYSKPCQNSKIRRFVNKVNVFIR